MTRDHAPENGGRDDASENGGRDDASENGGRDDAFADDARADDPGGEDVASGAAVPDGGRPDGAAADDPVLAGDEDDVALGGRGEAVRLSGLVKEYGGLRAVDGVDLGVEPGELLVLLGPSGCGKTTTLRTIAGLETATAGRIEIGDEDVTETLPQERDLSMVFQNYALYPHKTVRGNLRFPLGKTDLSDGEKAERVAAAAALLDIEDLLEKRPDQLSGGQRQRVALGRTIVREPRVFLMDEPLSNLDAQLRVNTRAELRDLQQRLGTTTVYVTHDQEEALSIADRVAIMNDGEVEQVGSPEAVYTAPANEFVAGFLGEPTANFLDVATRDGERVLFPADPLPVEDLLPTGHGLPDGTARVGVRPEDVAVLDAAGEPLDPAPDGTYTAPIPVTVGVVEPLGHSYEGTLRRGDVTLSFTAPEVAAGVGEQLSVALDATRLHAFDGEGEAL